ncbi:MAG: hypothetical protein AAGA54_08645 [Myxococcota bacterium]
MLKARRRWILAALTFTACREPSLVSVELDDPPESACAERDDGTTLRHSCIGMSASGRADVLFVVDAHASTMDWQVALADAMPTFVRAATSGREVPDLRVGIVAAQSQAGGCAASPNGAGSAGRFVDRGCLDRPNWFEDPDAIGACNLRCSESPGNDELWWSLPSGANAVDAEAFAEALRCAAVIGDRGCSAAEPFGTLRAVLARRPEDGAFFRSDAAPFIVVVSAADDCTVDPLGSATLAGVSRTECWAEGSRCVETGPSAWSCEAASTEHLVETERGIGWFGDWAWWWNQIVGFPVRLVTVTGGRADVHPTAAQPPGPNEESVAPSCIRGNSAALPPTRISEAIHSLHASCFDTFAYSLCEDSLDVVLGELGQSVRSAVSTRCIPFCVADDDLDAPGIQADCSFIARWFDDEGNHEWFLPACEPDGIPEAEVGCVVLRTGAAADPACGAEGWNADLEVRWAGERPSRLLIQPRCPLSRNRARDCPPPV